MDEKWRFCTRPVCRLRSDRSRDRQIYTRKRHAMENDPSADRLAEFEHFDSGNEAGGGGAEGRYCPGLCETEPDPSENHRRILLKKPSKG